MRIRNIAAQMGDGAYRIGRGGGNLCTRLKPTNTAIKTRNISKKRRGSRGSRKFRKKEKGGGEKEWAREKKNMMTSHCKARGELGKFKTRAQRRIARESTEEWGHVVAKLNVEGRRRQSLKKGGGT